MISLTPDQLTAIVILAVLITLIIVLMLVLCVKLARTVKTNTHKRRWRSK